MKQHPIEPSAKLFKIELVQDAKEFDIIINKEKQIDKEQAEQSAHTEEMLKGFENCEDNAIDMEKCPKWLNWGSWTACGKCGVQVSRREHIGCTQNGLAVTFDVCEENYGQKKSETEVCEGLPECENNKELLEMMMASQKAQTEAAAANMRAMMSMMQQVNTQNKYDTRLMMEQMQKNTAAIQLEIATMPSCFSESSTVKLCDGVGVSIKGLKRGDMVLSDHEGYPFCTKVIADDIHDRIAVEMIKLTAEENQSITLTGNHVIFKFINGESIPVFTKDLDVGDFIVAYFKPAKITKKEYVLDFPANPITQNGKVIVNGISATIMSSTLKYQLMEVIEEFLTQAEVFDPEEADFIVTEIKLNIFKHVKMNKDVEYIFDLLIETSENLGINLQDKSKIYDMLIEIYTV